MGLETATYIEDLVDTNPLGTDTKAQGDNHIRLIKKVLGNSFPNLGGEALTATAAELNEVFDSNRTVPTGLISMWSGATTAVPTGWSICDGTNGTPNLVGRFIVGSKTDAGAAYDVGDAGGSANINMVGTTGAHALTIAEMPSHTHAQRNNGLDWDTSGNSNLPYMGGSLAVKSATTTSLHTASSGSGSGHSHTLNYNGTGANLPPYYSLAYIMKL